MNVPIFELPAEDETLYSWERHLCEINGFTSFRQFMQVFAYPTELRSGLFPTDERVAMPFIYSSLGVNCTPVELYYHTTCYGGIAPLLSPARQLMLINCAWRLPYKCDRLANKGNSVLPSLRVCPMCQKEDELRIGRWYIHRAHQMPGVCVCHRHGCTLKRYTGEKNTEFNEANYVECKLNAEPVVAREFAKFARDFLNQNIECALPTIKEVIFKELKRRGLYNPKGCYIELTSEIESAGLAGVADCQIWKFLRVELIMGEYVSLQALLAILYYLFATAQEVDHQVRDIYTPEPIACEGYTVCADAKRNLIEVVHNSCGTRFCTTAHGLETGWGCPKCDAMLTDDELLRRIVHISGKGEYRCEQKYTGMDSSIILRHSCGAAINISPRSFIYEGHRCICESRLQKTHMENSVAELGDYKLLDYDTRTCKVEIKHETCGQTFTCTYGKFLKYPTCKACEPRGWTKEKLQDVLRALTGEEYALIDDYTRNGEHRVVIRHNQCGKTHDYPLRHFLDGQRCRDCTPMLRKDAYGEEIERLSGGTYSFLNRETRNLVRLQDNSTGNEVLIAPQKALQELRRPTPSVLLPKGDEKSEKDI